MIATDPGTITTIQGFGFSFRKPGSFHAAQMPADSFQAKTCPEIDGQKRADTDRWQRGSKDWFTDTVIG